VLLMPGTRVSFRCPVRVPSLSRGLGSRYGVDGGIVRRAAHRFAGANVVGQCALPRRVWPDSKGQAGGRLRPIHRILHWPQCAGRRPGFGY
jgi:hypothetical protein